MDYTRKYFIENKFPPTTPDDVTKMKESAPWYGCYEVGGGDCSRSPFLLWLVSTSGAEVHLLQCICLPGIYHCANSEFPALYSARSFYWISRIWSVKRCYLQILFILISCLADVGNKIKSKQSVIKSSLKIVSHNRDLTQF